MRGGDYRHKVLDYLIKTTGIDPIKRFFPNKLRNKNGSFGIWSDIVNV